MDNRCKLCQGGKPSPIPNICADCYLKLGLVPMPPPRRPSVPCQRCNGMRFIRSIPREHTAYGHDYVHSAISPMTVTQLPTVKPNILLPGNTVETPSVHGGRGLLEMYICAGCGFVEWYCHDPQSIPIAPELMTDIVDYTPATPYR